jgi:hypothetical protein
MTRAWTGVHYYDLWCENPTCKHASARHPICGTAYVYGTTIDPGSAGPTTCPVCDSLTTAERPPREDRA